VAQRWRWRRSSRVASFGCSPCLWWWCSVLLCAVVVVLASARYLQFFLIWCGSTPAFYQEKRIQWSFYCTIGHFSGWNQDWRTRHSNLQKITFLLP
jgi:hypothetical protein